MDPRMMPPPEVLEHLMMEMLMTGGHAASPGAPTISCPLCKEEYEYSTGDTSVRMSERCSHQARTIYCKHHCSICLEDYETGVAFKCGHIVCSEDFVKLGGRVGDESMKSETVVAREEGEKMRREMEARRREMQDEEGVPMMPPGMPANFLSMMQGVLGGAGGGRNMDMIGRMFGGGGPAGFGADDEDDDYEEEEEEDDVSTDDSMPPLLGPDGQSVREVGDDDSHGSTDSEMPALIGPGGQGAEVMSSDGDSDSDAEGNMPSLLPRGARANSNTSSNNDGARTTTASNRSRDTSNNNSRGSSSNTNNSRASGTATGSRHSNNNQPRRPQSTNVTATNGSDSEDSIPRLLPRGNDNNSSDESGKTYGEMG